jgi:hypothetical protein
MKRCSLWRANSYGKVSEKRQAREKRGETMEEKLAWPEIIQWFGQDCNGMPVTTAELRKLLSEEKIEIKRLASEVILRERDCD